MFPTILCEDNSTTSTTRWCDADEVGGGGNERDGDGGWQGVELAMITYPYSTITFIPIRFR